MQIYNSLLSPFGARVVIAMRVKDIPIERLPMSGAALRGAGFRKVNPIGKIPVLLTDDGMTLPESETILRYLEDICPDPSLLPTTPEQRARMNLLIRVTDLYVMAPVIRLFPHLDPAQRDDRVVASEVQYWRDGLAQLAWFLQSPFERPAAGLSLADCALPPSFHLCHFIAGILGLDDMLAPHPVITAYYDQVLTHPVVGTVLTELTEAQSGH